MPYYPKEHALRKLTQLFSHTGLKTVHDNSDAKNQQKHYLNSSTQLLDSKNKKKELTHRIHLIRLINKKLKNKKLFEN